MFRILLSNKPLLILLLLFVVLGMVGFVLGPIGAAFFGTQELLHAPKVHLPSDELFTAGPLSITNTILASWLTLLVLVLLCVFATRHMKLVPRGLQNLVEMAMETLLNFAEGVVGKEKARLVFPVVATIFLYVLFNAWISIIPIFGNIGLIEVKEGKEEIIPFLRNASTDLNLPLSIALFSFFMVEFWGMRSLGGSRYLGQFFNVRELLRGRPLGAINLFVGMLELLSHFIRIISFTFRLFGNMTAGKVLLLIATFLVPFIFAVPFYFLEILIGFVQALIFAGLTLVFGAIAMSPHEEGEQEAH